MKVYSANQRGFDTESTISELSSHAKDNSKEIKEACQFLQTTLSKKFKDFDISVIWSRLLCGYKVEVTDKVLYRTCILEPLNPQSRGGGRIDTNCIKIYEDVRVDRFNAYIKLFNNILKIQKTCIELIENNNLPTGNYNQEIKELKNSEAYRILRKYHKNPDIWIGTGKGWQYYRLCPNDIYKYQMVHVSRANDRVYEIYVHRFTDIQYIDLDETDILTTEEFPFTEKQLKLLNEEN